MSTNSTTKKMVYAALFTALCCVATLSIRIPIPGTTGFIHPGDAFVILSGVMLGPIYGGLAAGIGSALANLIGGHIMYMPATFVIKGLIALLAGLVYQRMRNGTIQTRYFAVGIGGIIDMILVAGGYFLYEIMFVGVATAALGIPWNLVQGVSGLVLALLLYPVLRAIPDLKQVNTNQSS